MDVGNDELKNAILIMLLSLRSNQIRAFGHFNCARI